MKSIIKPIFLALCSVILLGSCMSDESIKKKDFNVNVRMALDPVGINPMVGSASFEKTEVNSLIFLPLAHYDPFDFSLSPILIKEVPEPRKLENGSISYDYEILEDAVWDDGKPITSKDYLFTIKAALNPNVDAATWRGLLNNIDSVAIDPENDKKFSVIFKEYFMLALLGSATADVFPAHIYDPEGKLSNYSLSEIVSSDSTDLPLVSFAKEFNSNKYTIETISGAGPYKVKVWESDQYLVLERKDNYWGSRYPDRSQLANNPSEITFRIIADENAAATLLKDGSIDLMLVKSATVFDNLTSTSSFDSSFTIATPSIPRFYYIGLNNKKPELADKDVRRALAHLVDVDNIIKNLENGYAVRQVGTIMPAAEYYKEDMKPIEFDLEKAVEILDKEGWKDTNGNGIRDKVIEGKLVELEVDYLASKSPLGQKVGLLFQDNAKKVGVAVKMEVKEGRKMQESITARDYESAASAIGFSLATLSSYDPYQRWHSDNAVPGKGNLAGYENERNDKLIEIIRTEEDASIRRQAYMDLQELMYEEQPVIFLYSPTQKFVLSKKFKGVFTMKRPGYVVGSFDLVSNSL